MRIIQAGEGMSSRKYFKYVAVTGGTAVEKPVENFRPMTGKLVQQYRAFLWEILRGTLSRVAIDAARVVCSISVRGGQDALSVNPAIRHECGNQNLLTGGAA